MSVLEYLQIYGSDDSEGEEPVLHIDGGDLMEAEEDYLGFDDSGEQFPSKQYPSAWTDYLRSLEDAEETSCSEIDSDGSFTGEVEPRKKRKLTKKETRAVSTAKKRRLSHQVLFKDCGCKLNCGSHIAKQDQLELNTQFWKLNLEEQKGFFREHVQRVDVQNRRRHRYEDDEPKKNNSYVFQLVASNGSSIRVCRKFFLNTFGYGDNCGNIIYRCIEGDQLKQSQRGRYVRSTAKRDAIEKHIQTYGPTVSHYRREHAPHRLYLPSDLTEKSMHQNFQETHDLQVTYALYCKKMREMNISLVKLGNEECEVCVNAKEHRKTSGHSETEDSCSTCVGFDDHRRIAEISREAYRKDGETVLPDTVILAGDMQKVVQLPRLEGLKTIIFSRRLLAFNQTFAPVGKYVKTFPVVACTWDESTTGRSANDITSTFHRVLEVYKNKKEVVLWLDNCAAQNKNWGLFLHLILLINSKGIQVEKLTLKFFESGHTFNAADSYHASVERKMKSGPPLTFPDFKSVLQEAQSKVTVLDMQPEDFFETRLVVSQYTLNKLNPRPYMDQIKQVIIRKGNYMMTYGDSFGPDAELKSCMLFTKKQLKMVTADTYDLKSTLKFQQLARGIDKDRKTALLKVILPVISDEKKQFWQNLAEKEGENGDEED